MLETTFSVIFAGVVIAFLGIVALTVWQLWQQSRGVVAPLWFSSREIWVPAAVCAVVMIVVRLLSGDAFYSIANLIAYCGVVGVVAGTAIGVLRRRRQARLIGFVLLAVAAFGVLGGLSAAQ